MRLLGLVAMACVMCCPGCAQTADPLEAALATMAADANDLHTKLPSFECKESFTSKMVKGNKIKAQDSAEGTVRVERAGDGGMVEHFTASSEDGRPIAPEKLRVPLFVIGGFANALDPFLPERRMCLQFSLTGARLEYASRPNVADPVCRRSGGITSFALLDKDGHMVHHEFHIDAEKAQELNEAFSGTADLEALEFNGKRFWVSKHVTAAMAKNGHSYQWEATYSGCRLFSATVKMLPGDGAAGQ